MDHWKRIVAGLVAVAAAVVYATHSHAAAPPARTQAPGYFRMALGDFEITALSDGVLPLPTAKLLTNTTPQKVQEMLKRAFLADPVPTSVNAYLVNTGSKLVMIDAGAGTMFGPSLGKLLANLQAAGYQPEQIDEIYITHLHGDHVGGLVAGGRPVFGNATVRADRREADYWLSQANMDAMPDMADAFKAAMAAINPLVAAGKFKPFDGATELVPGIRSAPAYGHTKGHSAYMIESKGETMAVLGDLMHVAAVQFPNPAVTVEFDTDSKAAAAARKKLYAQTASGRFWLAIAHVSFPGIGHIRAEGAGYVYYPVNFDLPR